MTLPYGMWSYHVSILQKRNHVKQNTEQCTWV